MASSMSSGQRLILGLQDIVQHGTQRPFLVACGVVFLTMLLLWLCKRNDDESEEDGSPPIRKIRRSNSDVGLESDASVLTCRAEERGRFKHCGLRPDPLDESQGPPEYSLEPLDLPLPKLSAEQQKALGDMEKRVADLSDRTRVDRSTLIRYLRARKWNVSAAEKYFRDAEAWRRARGCERALLDWNLEAYERFLAPWWLSGGFLGHGKKGEQIAYERLARCAFPRLLKLMPAEQLEALDIVHCMRSLAALEEDALRTGNPLGDGILIQDCEGFAWEDATLGAAKSLNKFVNQRGLLMPECISKILVIRAPQALVYAWNMFGRLMDPGVRAKVRVAGPGLDTLNCLREFLSDDEIPGWLGGKRTVDGDPECRRVLSPGGPLPESVVREFLDLVRRGKESKSPQGADDDKLSRGACCPRRCG